MINSGLVSTVDNLIWEPLLQFRWRHALLTAYTCTVQRSAWQWSRITRVHLQSIDLPGPRGWGPAGTLRVLLILEPYVFSSHVLIWRSCRAANRVASGILFCAVGSGASRTAVSGPDWTAVRSELWSAVPLLLLSVVTPSPLCCPVSPVLSLHPPMLWLLFCLRSIHLFSKAVDPHELNVVCYTATDCQTYTVRCYALYML